MQDGSVPYSHLITDDQGVSIGVEVSRVGYMQHRVILNIRVVTNADPVHVGTY
ncbi:hypothetical protein MGP2080_03600 [marine gamma proteobacterium HTCC2080]|nr:hypothetical protein MGP2080_03600 [marine gamma proteobacterium HTCC2080]